MRNIIAFAVALLALGGQVLAADLGGKVEYQEPTRAYFQGLSVGAHLGGGVASVAVGDDDFLFDGISADGLQGGGDAEYLFAFGQRFRFGPYVHGGFSNYQTSVETGSISIGLLELEHYYGGGLKFGVLATQTTLIFGRVGYEWQRWNVLDTVGLDTGWFVLGGGVETMLDESWSLGVGVDYLQLDSADLDAAGGIDVTDNLDESEQVRGLVRAAYHF